MGKEKPTDEVQEMVAIHNNAIKIVCSFVAHFHVECGC